MLKPLLKSISLLCLTIIIASCGSVPTPHESVSKSPTPISTPKASKSVANIFVFDCLDDVQRPEELQLYCADGGQQLSKIVWSSWDKESALGIGISIKNTCEPYCAAGNYDTRKVNILLTDPTLSKSGKKVFTSVTLQYDKPLSNGRSEETVDLATEYM